MIWETVPFPAFSKGKLFCVDYGIIGYLCEKVLRKLNPLPSYQGIGVYRLVITQYIGYIALSISYNILIYNKLHNIAYYTVFICAEHPH
jgi:hypothetical protein